MYRILTVDDDPMCRMICSKTFAPEGFEMITASNGSQGMKTCAASKPDLVLLDVNLPDGNGIEICRRLKADERLRHIPILLMTGEAVAVESCVEGLEAGAEDYIQKPFTPRELVSRVWAILKLSAKPRLA